MSNDRNEVVLNVYGVMGRQEIVRGGIVEHPILDADGSQTDITTSTGRWFVEYNGENRPVRWTRHADGTLIEMSYDRMGRRIRSGADTFVYDGYLNIGSTIWDPTEPVATRPLVWLNDNTSSYYFQDGNKNVTDVTEGVLHHYDYAPFGTVVDANKNDANPWRFSSEYADIPVSMSYYIYRFFDSENARWIARDIMSEDGGVNVYNLYFNAPIGLFDVHGICPAVLLIPGVWVAVAETVKGVAVVAGAIIVTKIVTEVANDVYQTFVEKCGVCKPDQTMIVPRTRTREEEEELWEYCIQLCLPLLPTGTLDGSPYHKCLRDCRGR